MTNSNIYASVLNPPTADFQAVRDGRRTPIRYHDVDLSVARSISAGTAITLEIASDLFLADVDPVNQGEAVVHFQDTQFDRVSAPIYVTRGFKTRSPFTQLLIENAAQPGKRLRFFWGVNVDAEPGGNNVTVAGTVSIIDGEKVRTLAGQQFAGTFSGTPAAGQYVVSQLWNPLNSGKNVVVTQAELGSTLAGLVVTFWGSVQRANLFGGQGANKLAGGGGRVAEGRWQSLAAPAWANVMRATTYQAGASAVWPIKGAIVIPPGFGLDVISNVADSGLTFNAEWTEDPI